MDAYLYVVALAVFGFLYLVLGVFLVFSLLISLLAIYVYLVLRHGKLPEGYPYGANDTLITTIFIGVTWAIFTALGPKNPIPFVGSGLTYANAAALPVDAVIAISIVVLFAFLVIGAFVVPRLAERGRSGGRSGSGTMVQQNVGPSWRPGPAPRGRAVLSHSGHAFAMLLVWLHGLHIPRLGLPRVTMARGRPRSPTC